MTSRYRALLVMSAVAAVCLGAVVTHAQKKPAIAYPTDFRKWTHVKTMVIFSKEHKLYDRFGGMHNVYVNNVGWPALQRGRVYPDGSMFVFELFDIRTYRGAIEARGRKFVAVMKKNSKLYPKTGGWGFEVFQGYQSVGSLKDSQQCFDCHAERKTRDYVYSDYVE